MESSEKRTNPYFRGMKDYSSGVDIEDNPYESEKERQNWNTGWRDAKELEEDEQKHYRYISEHDGNDI